MEQALSLGLWVRRVILWVASLLKNEAAPGIVTLALVAFLLAALGWLAVRMHQRRAALNWLTSIIMKAGNESEFSAQSASLDAEIKQGARSGSRKRVAKVWDDYRETFVQHEQDGATILRNSVRPTVFFNLEDLRFSAGFWRIIPGLFVTNGLFLTFLGLISALTSMDLAGDSQRALNDLLTIASAKFIMSLTGLLCSIIFTIALRMGMERIESALHRLTSTIEDRLSYISLEDLAIEQLAAARESREHFRQLSLELVAEISRPLREELPVAISTSISAAMSPLISRVGEMSSQGVDGMVKDLSSRLSDDVGRALAQAAERISQAGDRIGLLADRLDQSSGRMGNEMEEVVSRLGQAVEDLRDTMASGAQSTTQAFGQGVEALLGVMNDTLEGIRDNTGEGARAMSAAATDMRVAAEGIRAELEAAAQQGAEAARHRMEAAGVTASDAIGAAGTNLMEAFGRTASSITHVADELSAKAGERLLEPFGAIAERLDGMVSGLGEGATELRRLSDGLREGSKATEVAAGTFRGAAEALTSAAQPILFTVERLEGSARLLAESTRNTADTVSTSARATAEQAAGALAAAREALGGQQRSIQATLAALQQALEQLRGQGETFDDIDQKLGRALDVYTKQVEAAVQVLFGHVKDMQDRLNPALDTMKAVVEQAETFAPQQRRA